MMGPSRTSVRHDEATDVRLPASSELRLRGRQCSLPDLGLAEEADVKRPTANADTCSTQSGQLSSEKRFHRVHDRLGPGADQRTRDPRVDRHSHEMPKRNGIRHGHSFPKAPKNQLVPNPKGLTASKTNATRVPDQRLSATQAPQSCPRSPPRNENRSCRGCESCPRLR